MQLNLTLTSLKTDMYLGDTIYCGIIMMEIQTVWWLTTALSLGNSFAQIPMGCA